MFGDVLAPDFPEWILRLKQAAKDVEADTSDDARDKIKGKLDLKKPEADEKKKD